MKLPEIARTATFRLTLGFVAAFAASALLLFVLIFWQITVFETKRVDGIIAQEAATLARETPEQLMWTVSTRISVDLRRLTFAAVFDADGHVTAGNLDRAPDGLRADGQARGVYAAVVRADGPELIAVRAAARRLPDGRLIVLARSIDELRKLRIIVLRAMAFGLIPAAALALASGALVSLRGLRRVRLLHQTLERIMRGDLHERLPTRPVGDEFDRLASSVNRTLDEIERLLDEIKGVGDDIAHDLRTPLGRVRARLERSRDSAGSAEEFQEAIDRAIIGIDQALAIITALLRISEIEAGRRRSGFGLVALDELIAELGELYAPIAEEKGIRLTTRADPVAVFGDRDLLVEALANLVGNAIKFTPPGGKVGFEATDGPSGPVLRVVDNGPGIPPEERPAVLKRFYRSDKSRHVEGSGLGLSLVSAIAELHGFALRIDDAGPGCSVELVCHATEAAEAAMARLASRVAA